MDTGVIIDAEVADPKGGDSIDQPHRPMTLAGIAEALDVVHAARAGFPMRHRGPFGFVLGQRGLDDVACHGLAGGHVDDHDVVGLRVQRIGRQFFRRRRLHPYGQAVDAGERAVHEHHHLIARHHG